MIQQLYTTNERSSFGQSLECLWCCQVNKQNWYWLIYLDIDWQDSFLFPKNLIQAFTLYQLSCILVIDYLMEKCAFIWIYSGIS